ncbi:MAG: hypothetical protein ACTSUE_21465 [Promethearchaeota archaeon]
MPLGLFLIKWDPLEGPGVFGKSAVQGCDLSQDQVNQIFMSHASGKKPAARMVMQVDNLSVLSRFMERKEDNTVKRCLLVLVLNVGEKAENFDKALVELEPKIWEYVEKSQLKVNVLVSGAFNEMKKEVTSALDAESIRKRVIKRAQDLLEENKINDAQRFLSASKRVPDQLIAAQKEGFNLRLEKKYEKSSRAYEEARRFAKMLAEPELADQFDKDAKRSLEIPILEKNREKAILAAREFLKREEFMEAAKKFTEAGELSERLDDIIGMELNKKKGEILSQYSELENIK